jgi:hypothetical protein
MNWRGHEAQFGRFRASIRRVEGDGNRYLVRVFDEDLPWMYRSVSDAKEGAYRLARGELLAALSALESG